MPKVQKLFTQLYTTTYIHHRESLEHHSASTYVRGCAKEFGDEQFSLIYDLLEKKKNKLKTNEEITPRDSSNNALQSNHSSELFSEAYESLRHTAGKAVEEM